MSVLGPILGRTPVTAIADVLQRMQEIDAALPASDGISCFNKLYMTVTANVLAAEKTDGFANVPFLSALDVTFGNLYFSALGAAEAGVSLPRAWAPLLAARARTDLAPLQFALAGMNAHINRDLPVGLVQTFTAMHIDMNRPSAESGDFDKVDDLLVQTEGQVRDLYLTPLAKTLHRDLDGVDDLVANWSVREARQAAWTNGAALWHLRDHPTLGADYLDALDGLVGFAGRGLLVSIGG